MARFDIHVVPHGDQSALLREGDETPISLHDKQADAERAGRQLAADGDVRFRLHPRDGARDTYNDDPRGSWDQTGRATMRWEHRVEVFGMEWRRNERLPDAEGLQRKLNEWGADDWELVSFEVVRDEGAAVGDEEEPRAAYLAILKRPVPSATAT